MNLLIKENLFTGSFYIPSAVANVSRPASDFAPRASTDKMAGRHSIFHIPNTILKLKAKAVTLSYAEAAFPRPSRLSTGSWQTNFPLVYLDPPYFTKRELEYVIDANDKKFHKDLLNECRKAKCMLLISGYQNDLYDEMLTPKRGWTKSTIKTHTRDTTGRDFERTEVLWMNGSYSKALKTGTVPIRLTKKEIKENKVNPIRKR